MRRDPALSAIVVHWGPTGDLGSLVDGWAADPRWELVVIDNGGGDEQAERPLTARRGVEIVRPGRNLGFAGGLDLGMKVARGGLLLMLNSDAVPRAGCLEALLEGAERLPEAAGLAPRLVGQDGSTQHRWQLRPLPRPSQLLLHGLLVDPVAGPVEEPPEGSVVEQPAAAALCLRRSVLERLGGFDPTFDPAWFEDVDLARRLAATGEHVAYWPRAIVEHRRGATVSGLGYRRFLWLYYRNWHRYLCRHHGAGWGLAGRLALVTGMLVRTLALPLRRPRRASSRSSAALAQLATAAGALTGWRRFRPTRPEAPT